MSAVIINIGFSHANIEGSKAHNFSRGAKVRFALITVQTIAMASTEYGRK